MRPPTHTNPCSDQYTPTDKDTPAHLAGQTSAIRVSGDPVSGNNGLFYYLTDHLGPWWRWWY